jgi:hypothetical protein
MTSTDALIRDLSADLPPVRRRSVRWEIGALVALGGLELALILMSGHMRHDMGRVILSPFMIWKMSSLAVLAGLSCTIAMRSFAPPATSRRDWLLMAGLAAIAIIAGAITTPESEASRSLIERLDPVCGVVCAGAIFVLSAPIVALLAVLMRRAAPVQPRRSALAAGLAASTIGALVFTACCPMNDPLYIIVWYSAGVAAVGAAARWLLPLRFRL